MGLLDTTNEEPKSKARRLAVSGVALALLLTVTVWYFFRFHAEKRVVEHFFDALVAGNTQRAYQIWQPRSSYAYKDFLEDWGPSGYYGPVKSYRIETAQNPRGGGSGVIVVVTISPFAPFPADDDPAKARRMREVRIWVEGSDHSLSFPP